MREAGEKGEGKGGQRKDRYFPQLLSHTPDAHLPAGEVDRETSGFIQS